MAFVENNSLKTRIMLKYDSYENWFNNNPVLLAGEVAIATVPAAPEGQKHPTGFANLPNVVMKVGDGTHPYRELNFVSALAADVHSWAKAETKPSYEANEIVGLEKFVTDISDIDTNTQYDIVPVAGATYKYELKKKDIGEDVFSSFETPVYIDMSEADERLDEIEEALKALLGSEGVAGGLQDAINNAISALDAEKNQAAGVDGLALHIKQEDGVITEFYGSIAAETYDAYGAAAAAEAAAKGYADGLIAQEVEDRNAAIAAETEARNAAIEALVFAGVEGEQAGNTVKFVDKIVQENGIVSAELGELVFKGTYDAATNKAATMNDVIDAVADLNGAMHFEGVYETLPTVNKDGQAFVAGDVIIVGKTEYVYSNGAFVELGDEGAIAAALSALTLSETGAVNKTLKISQANGLVTATAVDIAIAKSQVTDLEKDLKDLADEDDRLEGLIGDNADAIATINSTDTGKSMRAVAAEEAAAAVSGLNKDNAAQAGKYISAITQEDGLVTATYADLPVIPELKIEHGDETTPETDEVTVVGEISNDGHTITDTHVKVATKACVTNAIAALSVDKTVSSTKHVMTGVSQENGALTAIEEVELSDIAFSGDVKDLKQTANTYIVFNCGTSSDVI